MAAKAKKEALNEKPSVVSEKKVRNKQGLFLIGAGVVVLVVAGLLVFQYPNSAIDKNKAQNNNLPAQKDKDKIFVNPAVNSKDFKSINVGEVIGLEEKLNTTIKAYLAQSKAKSISIYFRDLTNENVIGIHEMETFCPASLMKVPVMIAILKLGESDRGILNKRIKFTGRKEQDQMDEGDDAFNTQTTLVEGESYLISDLMDKMIGESDNEATIMLLEYMDKNAPGHRKRVQEHLGLNEATLFRNTENFITVRRYSSFFRTLYNASYLSPEMSELALDYLSNTGFGNGIRKAIPSNIMVCHKYGFKKTDPSTFQYHQFGIVYFPKKPFLLGIMTKGGNPQDLKTIIFELTQLIFSEIESQSNVSNHHLDRDLS